MKDFRKQTHQQIWKRQRIKKECQTPLFRGILELTLSHFCDKKGHTKQSHDWSCNFGTLMLRGTRKQVETSGTMLSAAGNGCCGWCTCTAQTHSDLYVWLSEWWPCIFLFVCSTQQTIFPLPPTILNYCWEFLMLKTVMFSISHVHSLTILDPGCPSTDHKYPTVKTPMFSMNHKRYKFSILVETEFFLIPHM